MPTPKSKAIMMGLSSPAKLMPRPPAWLAMLDLPAKVKQESVAAALKGKQQTVAAAVKEDKEESKEAAKVAKPKHQSKIFWKGVQEDSGKMVRVKSTMDHQLIIEIQLQNRRACCATVSIWGSDADAEARCAEFMTCLAQKFANGTDISQIKHEKHAKAQHLKQATARKLAKERKQAEEPKAKGKPGKKAPKAAGKRKAKAAAKRKPEPASQPSKMSMAISAPNAPMAKRSRTAAAKGKDDDLHAEQIEDDALDGQEIENGDLDCEGEESESGTIPMGEESEVEESEEQQLDMTQLKKSEIPDSLWDC